MRLLDFTNYFITQNLFSTKHALSVVSDIEKTITTTTTNDGDELPQANSSNTFFAKGLLSTVLFPNYGSSTAQNFTAFPNSDIEKSNTGNMSLSFYESPKIVSGEWILNVSRGVVSGFKAEFKLLDVDGLDKHTIEINNFKTQDAPLIVFDRFSNTVINGFVDFEIDDSILNSDTPIEIKINKINTVEISINDKTIGDLFFGNTVYGIADSFRDFRNEEILVLDDIL
ncbi:MAG: hypothetical protein M3162_08070 [Thermoproteota archaeon]|nr:hypothetical protein [Thermoproteota archaeon]